MKRVVLFAATMLLLLLNCASFSGEAEGTSVENKKSVYAKSVMGKTEGEMLSLLGAPDATLAEGCSYQLNSGKKIIGYKVSYLFQKPDLELNRHLCVYKNYVIAERLEQYSIDSKNVATLIEVTTIDFNLVEGLSEGRKTPGSPKEEGLSI